MFSKKYRHKYTNIKDIWKSIRNKIKIKRAWSQRQNRFLEKNIQYKLFKDIVYRFFELLFEDVVNNKELVHLPCGMGYIYLDKKKNKRAFHYRVDINESNKQNKLVRYRVPILDDYYYKVVWVRPKQYSLCKIMPLTKVKKMIKCQE